MRDYSKIAPAFWTGETGRKIRKLGRDEQLLALFLLSSPNANMIGLYHLPLAMITHYLGWDEEGALKGLGRLSQAGFCHYDEASEEVWVPEMAAHQIGEQLDKKDKRVKGIIKEWQNHRKSKFYNAFYARYREAFLLPSPSNPDPKGSPLQAPCKPLASQEQEQEQEQDTLPLPPQGRLSECEQKKVFRSSYPCDNPELDPIARRIVKHYQQTVKSGHTERGGILAVIEQLQRGRSEQQLRNAVLGYVARCAQNGVDGRYRQSVLTFYSEGTCDEFLDFEPEKPSAILQERAAQAARERADEERERQRCEEDRRLNGKASLRPIAGTIGMRSVKEAQHG